MVGKGRSWERLVHLLYFSMLIIPIACVGAGDQEPFHGVFSADTADGIIQ